MIGFWYRILGNVLEHYYQPLYNMWETNFERFHNAIIISNMGEVPTALTEFLWRKRMERKMKRKTT
uniref:AlNc14C535G12083 protein n=1 Tax=Albugo laibachii Nc14 TaxID=890382 RepID=F0X0Z6_9STRA|nr:AlNc14C535G12083 [Albugo laibachii Nc14]|eukprot:CCA27442.1 AlNc14C535G12083 [Albugo laibachii Nc14]